MRKRFSFGLRAKLIITVITGVVFCVAIIGAYSIYHVRQGLMAEIQRSGEERATLIAEAFTNLVVGYDYGNMESLAERIVTQQDIKRVTVRNRNGKIMVAREGKGTQMDDPDLLFNVPIRFSAETIGSVELLISLERLRKATDDAYLNIVVALIFFATFLSLLMYQTTSRVIINPIGRIRDLMHNILNDPSDRAPRTLKITSQDALGELASIFNRMNAKVHEYQQRLLEQYNRADSELVSTNVQLTARTLELEKAISLVEQLAATDSLTQLPNRRHFDEVISTAFSRALRFNEPLSLILLDIDYFKKINDQYGHAAGDYVLQHLARQIQARTRETDVCSRLGGDEFAILLYHTEIGESLVMAADLVGLIRQCGFSYADKEIPVTLSVGVAQFGADTHSICKLYEAADQALYEAKRRGRNQAVAFPFQE